MEINAITLVLHTFFQGQRCFVFIFNGVKIILPFEDVIKHP